MSYKINKKDRKQKAFDEVISLKETVCYVAKQVKPVSSFEMQALRKSMETKMVFYKRKVFAKALGIEHSALEKESAVVVLHSAGEVWKIEEFFELKEAYCFSSKVDLKFAQLCEKFGIDSLDKLKVLLFAIILKAVASRALSVLLVPSAMLQFIRMLKERNGSES